MKMRKILKFVYSVKFLSTFSLGCILSRGIVEKIVRISVFEKIAILWRQPPTVGCHTGHTKLVEFTTPGILFG